MEHRRDKTKLSRVRRASIAILCLGALGAIALITLGPDVMSTSSFTDGSSEYSRSEWNLASRFVWRWQEMVELPGNYRSIGSTCWAPDSGDLTFAAKDEATGHWDLWRATKTARGYSSPHLLFELNSNGDERDPMWLPDGSALLFSSNRKGGLGGFDLFIARRSGTTFLAPERLPAPFNSDLDDRSPTMDARRRALIWATSRYSDNEFSMTLAEAKLQHDGLLPDGPIRQISELTDIDGETAEYRSPELSADGRFLTYSVERADSTSGFDLYRVMRQGSSWAHPSPLSALNTPEDEFNNTTSSEGRHMLFLRTNTQDILRPQLHMAERTEVVSLLNPNTDLFRRALLLCLSLIAAALLVALFAREEGLHPFVKFVLFSILAHVLFLLFVNTRKPPPPIPGSSDGDAFAVTFISGEDSGSAESQSTQAHGDAIQLSPVAASPSNLESAPSVTAALDAQAPSQVLTAAREAAVQPLSPEAPAESPSQSNAPSPSRELIAASSPGTNGPQFSEMESAPSSAAEDAVAVSGNARSSAPSIVRGDRSDASSISSLPASGPKTAGGVGARSLKVLVQANGPAQPQGRSELTPAAMEVGEATANVSTPFAEAEESLPTGSPQARPDSAPALVTTPSAATRTHQPGTTLGGSLEGPSLSSALTRRGSDLTERPIALTGEAATSPAAGLALPGLSRGQAREPSDVVASSSEREGPLPTRSGSLSQDSARPLSISPTRQAGAPENGLAEYGTTRVPSASSLLAKRSLGAEPSFDEPVLPMPTAFSPVASPGLSVSRASSGIASDPADKPIGPESRTAGVTSKSISTTKLPMDPGMVSTNLAASSIPNPGQIKAPDSLMEPRRGRIKAPQATVASVHGQRRGLAKARALEVGGGSKETEAAVLAGLRYLKSIQRTNGSWGPRDNHKKNGDFRIGKTGLALLAFLGSGNTHLDPGEFQEVVTTGLQFLLDSQSREGHFGNCCAYGHGIATYALAEAYAMTRDKELRVPLLRATRRILRAQKESRDPRFHGGWSYYYPDEDRQYDRWPRTSITAWQVMALKSAKIGGIPVPDAAFESAKSYITSAYSEDIGALLYNHSPQWRRSSYETLVASTPAGLFAWQLMGADQKAEAYGAALQYIEKRPPARRWRNYGNNRFATEGLGNLYYMYYSTLATFVHGGDEWSSWNEKLKALLLPAQQRNGSWRPISHYADYANDRDAAYTTAMCVLMLEVYYRYFTPLLTDMETQPKGR